MSKEKKIPTRISRVTGGLMIVFALLVDGIQFLLIWFFGIGLVVNRIITVVAWMILAYWLWWKGVSVVSFKNRGLSKTITQAGSFVVEMIPALAAFTPFVTFSVVITIFITYLEDKSGVNLDMVTNIKSGLSKRSPTNTSLASGQSFVFNTTNSANVPLGALYDNGGGQVRTLSIASQRRAARLQQSANNTRIIKRQGFTNETGSGSSRILDQRFAFRSTNTSNSSSVRLDKKTHQPFIPNNNQGSQKRV